MSGNTKQRPNPMYWDLLNKEDQDQYNKIRDTLSSSACKHRRHHTNHINQEIVSTVKRYVFHDEKDKWKRSLVCGICWLNDVIAINTRQLRILLSKCKSSINAMFQNIGYATVPTTTEYAGSLSTFFPVIKDNFVELRKWTIRFEKGNTPNNVNTNIKQDLTLEQGQTGEQIIEQIIRDTEKNTKSLNFEQKSESIQLN